jgi:hypothetical protein
MIEECRKKTNPITFLDIVAVAVLAVPEHDAGGELDVSDRRQG